MARRKEGWLARLVRRVRDRDEVAERLAGVQEAVVEGLARVRKEVSGEVARVRKEVSGEMARVREEVAGEVAGLREQVRKEGTGLREELAGELAGVREEVSGSAARARDELVEGLAGVREEVSGRVAGLQEAVERLEKASARAGKEQFKANALAEDQQQTLKEVMTRLGEAESQRQREVAQLRQELARTGEEARLELVEGLLPVLDGLDEALASGARMRARGNGKPARRPGFFVRLGRAVRLLFTPDAVRAAPAADPAMDAWLDGLEMVRERFLESLAAEGVQPIAVLGESFDPHRHVAVERVAAEGEVAPEEIVGERRRGYAAGDRVLRYAEVVVAR